MYLITGTKRERDVYSGKNCVAKIVLCNQGTQYALFEIDGTFVDVYPNIESIVDLLSSEVGAKYKMINSSFGAFCDYRHKHLDLDLDLVCDMFNSHINNIKTQRRIASLKRTAERRECNLGATKC